MNKMNSRTFAKRIVRRLDQQSLSQLGVEIGVEFVEKRPRSGLVWLGGVAPERSMVRHGDTFGALGAGADMADLITYRKIQEYKMAQLGKAWLEFAGQWAVKDPGGAASFLPDWTALQIRYGAALAASQSPLLALPFADITSAYNGLMKALKQNAPPDGAPVVRGDYQDLVTRLEKAGGKVDLSQMPQPGRSLSDVVYGATAPIDYVAMITGLQKPQGPGSTEIGVLADIYAFWKAHRREIVIGGMVIGGLMFFSLVAGAIKALPFAAKAASGGVL